MCFTRTRSPVRTRQETKLFFSCPDIIFAPWQARYDICKIWYLDTKNKIDTVHTVTQTFMIFAYFEYLGYKSRFYGVMVSTLDFESSDPSSNLGGTSTFSSYQIQFDFQDAKTHILFDYSRHFDQVDQLTERQSQQQQHSNENQIANYGNFSSAWWTCHTVKMQRINLQQHINKCRYFACTDAVTGT